VRTIQVPAGVVEYDEVGSGPPVVLLHGVLMDHTLWDRVLPLPSGFPAPMCCPPSTNPRRCP
jgi:pimeloyl-ACP methyl ester carboxylesterase